MKNFFKSAYIEITYGQKNKKANIVLYVIHLFCFLFRLRLRKKQNKCLLQCTYPFSANQKQNQNAKKSMKNIIWIFIFLPIFSYSQYEITGIVKDTIGIIPYANIIVSQSTNEIVEGTITNENGTFMLSVEKGTYNLIVSYVGYKNYEKIIEVAENLNLGQIKLIEDASILDEVVITSRKRIIERKADKLIFNVASSLLKSGFDGVEVLKRAPSIFVDGNDNILLQNKSATILINGRKLSLSGDELTNYIKSIEASNIKKIEIQANASSEMDANLQGGVINFILKKNNQGFFAQLKAYETQKGKHPNYYSSINLNYGTKKWNIYSLLSCNDTEDSGNVKSSTIYNTINKQIQEKGSFLGNSKRLSFLIGTTYQPNKNHEVAFEFYSTEKDKINKGNSETYIYLDNGLLDKGLTKTPSNSDTKYFNTSINYTIKLDTLNGKIKFIGDYAKQDFESSFNSNTAYTQNYYDNITERSKTDAKTNIISSQIDFDKTIRKIGDLSLGVKITSTQRNNNTIGENLMAGAYEIDNQRTSSYDFSENIYASYLTVSPKVFKDIYLKIGLRLENSIIEGENLLNKIPVSQNYFDYFPSLFLSKEFKKEQSISFNYNRKIDRPAFSILNPFVIKVNDFTYQIGNPNLKPQYRDNFNISYNLKKHSFSIFYNKTSELISNVYFPKNDAIYHQSQNVGKSKILGFYYSYGNNIKKWWYINFGTTFENQNYFLSETDFHSNKLSININNDWEISDTWSINLSAYYSSPYVYGYLEIEDYFSSNFILQKSFLDKKLKVRFYIDDIFNSKRDKNKGIYDDFTFDFYQKRKTQTFTLYALFTINSNPKARKKKNKSSNTEKNRL